VRVNQPRRATASCSSRLSSGSQFGDPGLQRVVDALINAAIESGRALIEHNRSIALEAGNDVQDAYRDLESAGRIESVLPSLLSHSEPAVRLWAAVLSWDRNPGRSSQVLGTIDGPLQRNAYDVQGRTHDRWLPRVMPLHTCPVCGWPYLHEDPAAWMNEICPSCGIQFGYDDASAGADEATRAEFYRARRKGWIDGGMRFWSSGGEPVGWDPKQQLDNARLE
jgi:hypothetical protein